MRRNASRNWELITPTFGSIEPMDSKKSLVVNVLRGKLTCHRAHYSFDL
jgi:hypothetical protein